jgi:hypothetical protein
MTRFHLWVVVMLCASSVLRGQAVNGSLIGTITDTSGAGVPGAQVTLTEANTGVERAATTASSGNYSFPSLQPGSYTVSVEQQGFQKAAREKVDVTVNSTVRVDLTLQPGSVNETITVTAATPPLKTDRADTGRTIESRTLEDLPVGAQRQFQTLTNLVPGTTRAFRPHSQFFNPQNALSTQVNGQSRLANNLQFEGVDDNTRTGLLQVMIPPIEALQTVDVSTSNFDAELGRATGAVTNIVLKSGTNEFHGQAYWYNRVSALSARNFFDPVRSHFVYNYVGGQAGGPIVKNKLFFFVDYLRQMDHRYNVDRYTLPLAPFRGGDFSASPTTIYDPTTGNRDGTGRAPFSGNIIPANRIQTIPQKIMGFVPLPNLPVSNNNPTNDYYELIPFVRNTNQYDVKGDYNPNEREHISVRYSYENPETTDGSSFGLAGGPHNGGFQGTGRQGTHDGAINWDHVFSPTFVMQMRAGVSRYRNDAQQFDYGTNASEELGVPGVNTQPFTSGLVGIQVDDYSNPLVGYSPSLPWIRAETNIDVVDNFSKTFSKHTLKFGADLRRIRDDLLQTETFGARGLVKYGENQTSLKTEGATEPSSYANSFASFLLDAPYNSGRDLPIIFPAYRAYQFFTYVNDQWLVTPKLTLNLGLRWELYPSATPAHTAGFSNYDPATNSLVIAGVGGNPLNLGRETHYNDFAPRFGLAYRVTEKTVVRGGFGISYSPFPDDSYAYNFPVKQNNSYTNDGGYGIATLPGGANVTLAQGFPAPTLVSIPDNGIIPNADINQLYFVVNKHFRQPYVESWNLAVQQALPGNFALDVAYVANHGVAQPCRCNINAATVVGLGNAGQPAFAQFGRTAETDFLFQGFSSSYNSLQVKLDRRFSNGLGITTAFTWGKALGYQDEDGGLAFYVNGQVPRNWKRLDFDRKFNFIQSYIYELPFGKGKKLLTHGVGGAVLGGWQVNGILSILSGTPLNTDGIGFVGNDGVLGAPGNSNTLNFFGGSIPTPKGNPKDGQPWFTPNVCSAAVTTDCFAQPGNLQFGNLSPNVISGPGSWSLDASIFRTFAVTERLQVQIRGEAFSLMNTPTWDNPDTNIGNKTFGYITSAEGNRAIQLGAKVFF